MILSYILCPILPLEAQLSHFTIPSGVRKFSFPFDMVVALMLSRDILVDNELRCLPRLTRAACLPCAGECTRCCCHIEEVGVKQNWR